MIEKNAVSRHLLALLLNDTFLNGEFFLINDEIKLSQEKGKLNNGKRQELRSLLLTVNTDLFNSGEKKKWEKNNSHISKKEKKIRPRRKIIRERQKQMIKKYIKKMLEDNFLQERYQYETKSANELKNLLYRENKKDNENLAFPRSWESVNPYAPLFPDLVTETKLKKKNDNMFEKILLWLKIVKKKEGDKEEFSIYKTNKSFESESEKYLTEYMSHIEQSFVKIMEEKIKYQKEKSWWNVHLDYENIKSTWHDTLQWAVMILGIFGTTLTGDKFLKILSHGIIKVQSLNNLVNNNMWNLSKYPQLLLVYKNALKDTIIAKMDKDWWVVDLDSDILARNIENHIEKKLAWVAEKFNTRSVSDNVSEWEDYWKELQNIFQHIAILHYYNIAFKDTITGKYQSEKFYEDIWQYFGNRIDNHIQDKKILWKFKNFFMNNKIKKGVLESSMNIKDTEKDIPSLYLLNLMWIWQETDLLHISDDEKNILQKETLQKILGRELKDDDEYLMKYIPCIETVFAKAMKGKIKHQQEKSWWKTDIDHDNLESTWNDTLQGATMLFNIFWTTLTSVKFSDILSNGIIKDQALNNLINDNLWKLEEYPELLSGYRTLLASALSEKVKEMWWKIDLDTNILARNIENHVEERLEWLAKIFHWWYESHHLDPKQLEQIWQDLQQLTQYIAVLRRNNIAFKDTIIWKNQSQRFYEDIWKYFSGDVITTLDSDNSSQNNEKEDNKEKNKELEHFKDFFMSLSVERNVYIPVFITEIKEKRTLSKDKVKRSEKQNISETKPNKLQYNEWMYAWFDEMEKYLFTEVLQKNDDTKKFYLCDTWCQFLQSKNINKKWLNKFLTSYNKKYGEHALAKRNQDSFLNLIKKLESWVDLEQFLVHEVESLHILTSWFTYHLFKEQNEGNVSKIEYSMIDMVQEEIWSWISYDKLDLFFNQKLSNKAHEDFDIQRVRWLKEFTTWSTDIKGNQFKLPKENSIDKNDDRETNEEFFVDIEQFYTPWSSKAHLKARKWQSVHDKYRIYEELIKKSQITIDDHSKSSPFLISLQKDDIIDDSWNLIAQNKWNMKDILLNRQKILSTEAYINHSISICNELLQWKAISGKGRFNNSLVKNWLINKKWKEYILNVGDRAKRIKIEYLLEFLNDHALFNAKELAKKRETAKKGRDFLIEKFDNDDFRKKCNIDASKMSIGPYKDYDRAFDKVMNKYSGNISWVKDMSRMLLVANTKWEMTKLINNFGKYINNIDDIEQFALDDMTKNDYETMISKWTGYREMRGTLRLKDGNTVEVQFHYQPYVDIKKSRKNGWVPIDFSSLVDDMRKYDISFDTTGRQELIKAAKKQGDKGLLPLPEEIYWKREEKRKFSWNKNFSLNVKVYADYFYKLAQAIPKTNKQLIKNIERLERILYNRANGQLIVNSLKEKWIL